MPKRDRVKASSIVNLSWYFISAGMANKYVRQNFELRADMLCKIVYIVNWENMVNLLRTKTK